MIKVLHITPSFYPALAWGGPIFSTKAICDAATADRGITLRVLTTDALGPNSTERLAETGREVEFAEGYRVYYARRLAGHSISGGLLWRLPAAIAWADVVHLTGTYNFPTLPTLFISRLLRRRIVWSPRGALQATEEWANAPRRSVKHAFETLTQMLRPKDCVLLVTSREEAESSTKRLHGIDVRVIPNSVSIPPHEKHYDRRRTGTRLIFLSRLHEKKGIEHLIDAMHRLPNSFTLDIFGAGSLNYTMALQDRAGPLGDRVAFHGIVAGDKKEAALRDADIFVLPTHSENFGIVIAEALAVGTPVITTTRTPWQDLDRKGCGRCIDLETTDLARTIRDMSNGDLETMGRKGRGWMIADFSPEVIGTDIRNLYKALAQGRNRDSIDG